uniref:Endonuclease/exonuclease/phosphatase domain-containing protein n=1 Tax=Amorphochlora amoebiformis TaxID=1561963 RepID=A0A7S0GNL2_9EUKA|mmetsp:Transcript_10039/g.15846  ORF Transcript_10039/g.15846 Transcript_10039/m.15846 type:complete len:896 (+) Transcript_10039:175-2862(+)
MNRQMDIENEYAELSNSFSGCTVSPRHEAKRAGVGGFDPSPRGPGTPRNEARRYIHRHNASFNREPDGLRTPRDEEDETPSSRGSSARGSVPGREFEPPSSRNRIARILKRPPPASERKAAVSVPDFTKVSPIFVNNSPSISPRNSSPESHSNGMDAEAPPPAPKEPMQERKALSNAPPLFTSNNRSISPLRTSKHSDKRGGFQWNITPASSSYQASTYPRRVPRPLSSAHVKKRSLRSSTGNEQAKKAPKSSESSYHVTSNQIFAEKPSSSNDGRHDSRPMIMPRLHHKKTAKSNSSIGGFDNSNPSHRNHHTKSNPTLSNLHIALSDARSEMKITVSTEKSSSIHIPGLKIDSQDLPSSKPRPHAIGKHHRRSPSAQDVYVRPRHRPPPLDLFEIVRLPQPVVGVQLHPEIADPSKRPDSIVWSRKVPQESKIMWKCVCDSWEYTPTPQDVGCVLRVTLRVNEKPYVDISNPVIPHPTTPSPRPWKHLPYRTPSMDSNQDKFRLLTWNTLADAATRNGFKGKCPGWALQWPYRKDNLLKHIKGYDADIICMQEVDKKYWNSHWSLSFQSLGYDGEYGGSSSYGCAIFYRTSVFRKVKHHVFSLDTAVQWARKMRQLNARGLNRSNKQMRERFEKRFEEESRMLKCSRRALIFELERVSPEASVASHSIHSSLELVPCTPMGPPRTPSEMKRGRGERVFIATVHLYKSDARPFPFVRLLQAHMLMEELKRITHGVPNARILVAGDFNSGPQSSIYRYMQNGIVRKDDADVKGCSVIPCDLRNPYPMNSAYRTILGVEQRYRRKKSQQTPVVEYVWCSEQLSPVGVVPIPVESADKFAVEKLSSDHQPLVVDIALPTARRGPPAPLLTTPAPLLTTPNAPGLNIQLTKAPPTSPA